MKQFRVGVIGLGMGRHHIQGYQAHPRAQVVAIADTDPNRLEEIGNRFHVPVRYTSAETMLARERLDVVSIATPNKFHKPLTIAALKAGAHVLCEKPMAMNAREAREMLAAAKKARRRIMINFSYRFTEAAQSLKRHVDTGVLGDVYFARSVWHRSRGMPGFGGWFGIKALSGGGPLIDLGVHRLDLALWLMGYPRPAWVMGSTYDHIARPIAKRTGKRFDVEDLAVGLVKFTNGAMLEIEASWAANLPEAELMETRLLGTKGGLVQRNLHGTYEFEGELYLERKGRVETVKPKAAKAVPGGAMGHFIECLATGQPHIATGEQGATVMEILDAIYASAECNAPVRIR
ncbi:MAG: Gfo/Idh/MocA family oxidoreductase [Candidatus Coatesbacteria bacterium]